MTLVDGIAIMFSWVSLLFALLGYNSKNIWLLKLYGVMFFIPHILIVLSIYINRDNGHAGTSKTPSFSLFEKCSNEMLHSKNNLSQQLSEDDHHLFEQCLKQVTID
jgi:hypothetical protein